MGLMAHRYLTLLAGLGALSKHLIPIKYVPSLPLVA